MALHPIHDVARQAQCSFDSAEDPRITAESTLDSTAWEALRASPSLLEDALGYEGRPFWARAARLLDANKDAEFAELFRSIRDKFANERVEDTTADENLHVNAAIDHLLKRYAA